MYVHDRAGAREPIEQGAQRRGGFGIPDALRGRNQPRRVIEQVGLPEAHDLDARLAPEPDLLAALRELGVLLDRDAHGEFLHFYTAVLGDRVFFEVVERRGGYRGYGEVNAPVRMAAHRRLRSG